MNEVPTWFLLVPCSSELQRERRRVHGAGLPVQLHAEDQAHADLLQAPPAQDHEVLLRHQPQPGCEGPETAGSEDGPHQEGPPGTSGSKRKVWVGPLWEQGRRPEPSGPRLASEGGGD